MSELTDKERLDRLERALAQLAVFSTGPAAANKLRSKGHPDLAGIVDEYQTPRARGPAEVISLNQMYLEEGPHDPHDLAPLEPRIWRHCRPRLGRDSRPRIRRSEASFTVGGSLLVNAMSTNVAGQSSTSQHGRAVASSDSPANPELSATRQHRPTWREENQLF